MPPPPGGANTRALEPLAVSIANAVRISDLSRSEIYRKIATGEIVALKSGVRTLIPVESLRAYLSSLPVVKPRPSA